jgi:iron complex transport system substrate-binding protein
MVSGWRRLWTGLLLAAGIGLPAAAAITLTDDRGHQTTLARPAQRVVSLLPSLTESVCALQACDRLVGVDRFSNWPAQVQALPQLGGLEDTTIERLVRLKPDLVLAAVSARALGRLEALGLTVLALEPRNLADTRRVLELLAQALGRPGDGERLWSRIDQRLVDAAARVPARLRGQAVYFEVSSAPYAAGEASFVGEVLARLALGNVVPASMGPFPKLNPEFVLRARPGIVMASARGLASMPDRPGWATLPALRDGRSCGFPEARYDVLVRPGPRLAEAAELIADCLVRLGGRQ